ncbi:carbonic anhydrase [Choiromyces venosus 120613-1]|uniref:Carbonic anhydrase n=1 Tax=Choiromyces venosus 120613-1 TaxID=1336337 RepID=A0A3N4JJH6_9PEZI|nr:carbonic anhydrase [Choiromyces venosus 120613-1]
MRSFILSSFLLSAALPSTLVSACLYKREDPTMPPFSYTGETGPLLWHNLTVDGKNFPYHKCATGKQQSPIDITDLVPLAKNTTTSFPSSGQFTIENNGHTIEATPQKPEDYKSILGGQEYKLKQFHFHVSSEHHLHDETFPLEAHFVHTKVDDDSKLAVVGIFFDVVDTGAGDMLIQSICPELKELEEPKHDKREEKKPSAPFNVQMHSINNIIDNSKIRNYPGSLTTPPCSEQVSWYVVEEPLAIIPKQFNRLKKIMKFNSRFTQNNYSDPPKENLLALVKQTKQTPTL